MNQILSDDIQDIAVSAGALVLENGGETYRAEDTVVHVANALGARDSSAFVTPTVVMFSYIGEDNCHHTFMRRIFKRGTNMLKLALINDLSRRLVLRGKTSNLKLVRKLLHRIEKAPEYSCFVLLMMGGLSSMFFTFMFSGTFQDSCASFFIGAITRLLLIVLCNTNIGHNNFLMSLISGALISLLADVSATIPLNISSHSVLAGSIMQVVPGLAFVNGIRDIISGDLVSGGARILDAVMIGAGLSMGSVIGVFFERSI